MFRRDFAVGLEQVSVPSEKVEAIRETTDIVAWIGRCVSLKKSGRGFVGLCPFHAEKSPSFSVSSHKAMYYCFGCHVGGDVFDFVMRYDSLDFNSAARKLAEAAGIAVDPDTPEVTQRRQREQNIIAVNAAAHAFFTTHLWEASGTAAQRYLTRRQILPAFARAQELGYGGEATTFTRHMQAALATHHLPETLLAESGLVGENEGWPLFTGRLIFPIHDAQGRLVGFGGRRLSDDASTPKYINSRESILFSKKRLLFGLHQAQTAVRRSRRLVFVEGYMDVLAAHRAGIPEAVAAMGTTLTPEHAALCRRVADVAYLLLDADDAGLRAAYKASSTLLAAPVEVRLVALPKGEDPDSLVRKSGPEALQTAVAEAVPAVEFFMAHAFAAPNLSVEARARAARHLMPLLFALPCGLERDLYMGRLADHVGVTTKQLKRHVRQVCPPSPASTSASAENQRSTRAARRVEPPAAMLPELPGTPRFALRLPLTAGPKKARRQGGQAARELDLLRELLLFPCLRVRLGELAEYMLIEENAALLETLAATQEPVRAVLATHLSDPYWRARLEQVNPVRGLKESDVNAQANRTFDDILARLKWRHIDAFLAEVLQQIAQAEAAGQATEALMRRKQDLTARKRSLKRATRIERVRA